VQSGGRKKKAKKIFALEKKKQNQTKKKKKKSIPYNKPFFILSLLPLSKTKRPPPCKHLLPTPFIFFHTAPYQFQYYFSLPVWLFFELPVAPSCER